MSCIFSYGFVLILVVNFYNWIKDLIWTKPEEKTNDENKSEDKRKLEGNLGGKNEENEKIDKNYKDKSE